MERGGTAGGSGMGDAVWFVSLERDGTCAEWDCEMLGPPDPRHLRPTRRPASGDFSRHIPRRAYAVTTGSAVDLESGLEHDLLRSLDLNRDVVWLVGQPVRFHFPIAGKKRAIVHTPDLLSQHEGGGITLWDARPKARQDDGFTQKVELAAVACHSVGWRHEVFEGVATPRRMNLLWLNGYRRAMPWHSELGGEIEGLLRVRPRTVSELRGWDDGSGELVATMWYLIATGRIACDLSQPIRDSSLLIWSDAAAPGSPSVAETPRVGHARSLAAARLAAADR